MLAAVLPHALKDASVCPPEDAVAMLPVVLVFAFVDIAIIPGEQTFSVHPSPLPLTLVGLAGVPVVLAEAVKLIFLHLPLVVGAVGPGECAGAGLDAGHELAVVDSAIRPALFALALLQVLNPLAFVGGAPKLRAVIDTVPIGAIGLPLALVVATIRVVKPAGAFHLVILPLALILGTIVEYLLPAPVPALAREFTLVAPTFLVDPHPFLATSRRRGLLHVVDIFAHPGSVATQ
jgi:hypothetical protein